MIAAVMCGGKGKRMMNPSTEKSLIRVNGKTMVEHVLDALVESHRFQRIVAAVSPNTPKTKELVSHYNAVNLIETPGSGFSADLSFLLSGLKPEKVLIVPADLPLLDSTVVSEIIDMLVALDSPATSIVLTKSFAEKVGAKPSVIVNTENPNISWCHSGITLFDTSRLAAPETIAPERYILLDKKEVALNVNTESELDIATRLYLVKRAKHLAQNRGL